MQALLRIRARDLSISTYGRKGLPMHGHLLLEASAELLHRRQPFDERGASFNENGATPAFIPLP